MRLMDFFKSNRKSAPGSNLASARQAIYSLAQYAEDLNIREAALRHIKANLSDEKKYALENRFISLDPGTRAIMEAKLSKFDPSECENDQAFLFDVSKNAFSSKDRLQAINQLSNQLDLMDIAINSLGSREDTGLKALFRLIDQDLIAAVATEAKSSDVIREAIDRINNQKVLKRLAKKADSFVTRNFSVQKLVDQKTLGKIALSDREPSVRSSALERIHDQAIFKQVARHDDDPCNRIFAIKKIYDQGVISKIAKHDSDKKVRLEAIKKIEDKKDLADLAENDSDSDIRETAAYRLSDEKLNKRILYVKNAKHEKHKNELISYAREYFNNMSIVKVKKSFYNDSVQNGTLTDVLNMLDQLGKFSTIYDEDPRETWRTISYSCEVDCASFTLNVRNYMSDNGWVYDDITRIIIKRTAEEGFIWYQEEETRESN